jgi:hypothetical protein
MAETDSSPAATSMVWRGRPSTLWLGPTPVQPSATPQDVEAASEDPRVIPSVFPPTYSLGFRLRNVDLTGAAFLGTICAFLVFFFGEGASGAGVLVDTASGLRDYNYFPYDLPIWPLVVSGLLIQTFYLCARSKMQWICASRYGWGGFHLERDSIGWKQIPFAAAGFAVYWAVYSFLVVLDWAPAIFFGYLAVYVAETDVPPYTTVLSGTALSAVLGWACWTLLVLFIIKAAITHSYFSSYERSWALVSAQA